MKSSFLFRTRSATHRAFKVFLLSFVLPVLGGGAVPAAPTSGGPAEGATSVETILNGIVRVSTRVPATARTAATLGAEREGSGVVIDANGLVLTIGYIMLEAESAEIGLADGRTFDAALVAYDHDTGFGLLRAAEPLDVPPIELGDSGGLKASERVLVASHGGQSMAMAAMVVSRRPFAGYWEYLLEKAIFTTPPHPAFGGAALISSRGRLLGIGSLIVPDAAGPEQPVPGNMFIPVDDLKPILAELLDAGRTAKPRRPWLGLYSQEIHGRLFVTRVAAGGPAQSAGMKVGDLVIGVDGKAVSGLADFYRKLWALGPSGITVRLDVLRGASVTPVPIKSTDRYRWLRLNRSY
jgi:S1-C subfamily serine protease